MHICVDSYTVLKYGVCMLNCMHMVLLHIYVCTVHCKLLYDDNYCCNHTIDCEVGVVYSDHVL